MAAKKNSKPEKSKAERKKPMTEIDKVTVREIVTCATNVRTAIDKLEKPELKFPERSLRNANYDKKGGFKMGRGRIERTLTVNTVKTFAQTLKLMALSKEMVEQDDFATKREAYYVSKNWGEAKFTEQPESDTVMDDIEALFSLEGVTREQLRFRPEEHPRLLPRVDREPHHVVEHVPLGAQRRQRRGVHLAVEVDGAVVPVAEGAGLHRAHPGVLGHMGVDPVDHLEMLVHVLARQQQPLRPIAPLE